VKRTLFRIAAVILGLGVGVLAWQGVVVILLWIDPPPVPVGPEQRTVLREKLDENPRSLFLYDEKLAYRLKPSFRGIRSGTQVGIHETNSLGLLGREEVPEGDGVRRVLFLGDSVTYGDRVGLEETFAFRIGRAAGPGVWVGNAACPGWSTWQELAFYEDHLSAVDWDLVVLVFCLNDLVRYEWVHDDEGGIRLSEELRRAEGLGVVADSVEALRIKALRRRLASDPRTRELKKLTAAALYAFHPPKWEEFERETLAPRLGGGRIPNLLVLAIPSGVQLVAAGMGAPPDAAFYPQRRLEQACDRLGVPFLDAAPALRAAGKPGELFLDAFHLSPKGHRVVAEFLGPEIARRLR
jgi:hypothetical protein